MKIISSKKLFSVVILSLITGFAFSLSLRAEPPDKAGREIRERREKGLTDQLKSVSGQVSVITNDHIGIIYKREGQVSYEMGFDLTDELSSRYRSPLNRIDRGDTVRIEYKETKENYEVTYEDGSFREVSRVTGREAVRIHFVRSGDRKFYLGE